MRHKLSDFWQFLATFFSTAFARIRPEQEILMAKKTTKLQDIAVESQTDKLAEVMRNIVSFDGGNGKFAMIIQCDV